MSHCILIKEILMKRAVKKASARRSVAKKATPRRGALKKLLAKPAPKRPAPIPANFHAVTPHLVISNATAAIEFYKKAFGAVVVMFMPGPSGGVAHAELKIGDALFMLADEWPGSDISSPTRLGGTTAGIHLYVKDCDAVFNQAVAAGAKVSMPLMNMFWGDRFGKVTDPFGHSWAIATHVEDVSPEECIRRGAEAMKNMMPQPS
jgi:uncharacterized glyoxalase superfamily protein PhnB